MPTASVKSDSTSSSENQDPLGKLFLSVEKKIRNLEKRKNKLEFYKAEINEGKELNEDQQKAVDAFDAVVASLELCKDFSTQIENVIAEHAKLVKVHQKKQQEEKAHHEFERIKQVLKVQDVLKRISLPEIRADFLSGTNGAVQVKEEQLNQLEEVSKLVTPPIDSKREKTNAGFKVQINTAAENMICFLDGKNKAAAPGTTYREMKTLVHQIANCPYPKVHRVVLANASPSPQNGTQNSQKSKKSKGSRNKNQVTNVPNGTAAATGECLPSKINSKVNSRLSSSSSKISTKPVTSSAASDTPNVVVPDPNVCLTSSPSKSVTQDPPLHSTGKSNRQEIHSAPEGPPPGITPTSVVQQSVTSNLIAGISPQVRAGIGATAISTSLNQNAFFGPTQNQPPSQASSRVSLDINDLVTSGSFNFLQESQVVGPDSSQAAVYVDPAVVSFCSMKPENLVQLREQKSIKQLTTSQTVSPASTNSVPSIVTSHQQQSPLGHIPSETFINQSFVSSTSSTGGFSQVVSSFSSNSGIGEVGGNNSMPPAPISLQLKEEKKSYIEPSTSWAAQEDTDGWGTLDNSPTSVNGGDSSWVESSTWGESSDVKSQHSSLQDVGDEKRGGGYRGGIGRSRGSMGNRGSNSGGFRGRGNYNSYQGGGRGNSFGGNCFNRGGRGSNGGGGYRGRGNFSRGRGCEGNSRGGMRRGSYQGNSIQRNQY